MYHYPTENFVGLICDGMVTLMGTNDIIMQSCGGLVLYIILLFHKMVSLYVIICMLLYGFFTR